MIYSIDYYTSFSVETEGIFINIHQNHEVLHDMHTCYVFGWRVEGSADEGLWSSVEGGVKIDFSSITFIFTAR